METLRSWSLVGLLTVALFSAYLIAEECPDPVTCPALTVPDNGTVDVSGPQPLGTIATYSCDHWLVSGSRVRYCVTGGTWTGMDPTCAPDGGTTRIICEDDTETISCSGSDVININSAYYGRTAGPDVCPHSKISNTSCQRGDENDLDLIKSSCEGQTSCELYASNSVFGDPCVGTYKYIEVSYSCLSEESPAPTGECPALPAPDNGTVDISGPQSLGTIANYMCNHGLVSGSLVRYCVGVGVWTGTEPICASAMTDGNCGPLTCGPREACKYPVMGMSPPSTTTAAPPQRRRRALHGPVCVPMNNCTGPEGEGCYNGLRCCGHGIESCVCEAPKMINTVGLCKDCDCMWNERCTVPHGKCTCGDYQVRDHYGNCVDCDPELSCPKCGHDRTCSINPGDKSSSCECLPGSVERDGKCVWCKPCPRDCDRDHVCITPGFSDPYCGCPGGMDEIDGECVTCPRCPDCGPDRKCVVRDGYASCECPHSTYDTPWGCIPLNTCPSCQFDDHEVCVLPTNGSPHCECADGYVRDRYQKCVACVQDECQANADCTHTGEICYAGQCKCADGWALHDGECIPDGYLGGSCKLGRCHGRRTHCSSHGQCECNDDCYKEPIWACIPKRKKYYW